jgi:hypothetical protein
MTVVLVWIAFSVLTVTGGQDDATTAWMANIDDTGARFELRSPGIDEHAAPSLILAGVAKAGTTDLWSLINGVHPWFQARERPGHGDEPAQLVKEFNVGFISGDVLNNPNQYPCPADIMNTLM